MDKIINMSEYIKDDYLEYLKCNYNPVTKHDIHYLVYQIKIENLKLIKEMRELVWGKNKK
jgi:hypothetical protein